MYPTTDIRVFLHENGTELNDLVSYICRNYNYPDSYDDIIQDVYIRMFVSKFIEKYKEEKGKISSYIYPLIRNIVVTRMRKRRATVSDSCLNDSSNIENHIDPLYYSQLRNNHNDLEPELKGFEKYLNRKNVKFKLLRRKNPEKTEECSLLSVFHYFYEGYTAREIAFIYGVTPMAICNIKYKLAEMMRKYGIETSSRLKKEKYHD